MKTTTIATLATIAILIAGVAAVAVADSDGAWHSSTGSGSTSSGSSTASTTWTTTHWNLRSCRSLTVGQTLTFSGLKGHFFNASSWTGRGNATGSFTFQVSGIFVNGCTFTLTAGTFMLNSTSYSVTGGSIIMSREGHSGSGMGTTSGGSFLIQLSGLRGNSTSVSKGAVGLDFKTGTSEFLVQLNAGHHWGHFGH